MRTAVDEATFRTTVPAKIGRAEVLEVHGYTPGDSDGYSYAVAVCRWVCLDGVEYSSHTLVCADDRPEWDYRWFLINGTYHQTRQAATDKAIKRAR